MTMVATAVTMVAMMVVTRTTNARVEAMKVVASRAVKATAEAAMEAKVVGASWGSS